MSGAQKSLLYLVGLVMVILIIISNAFIAVKISLAKEVWYGYTYAVLSAMATIIAIFCAYEFGMDILEDLRSEINRGKTRKITRI